MFFCGYKIMVMTGLKIENAVKKGVQILDQKECDVNKERRVYPVPPLWF